MEALENHDLLLFLVCGEEKMCDWMQFLARFYLFAELHVSSLTCQQLVYCPFSLPYVANSTL